MFVELSKLHMLATRHIIIAAILIALMAKFPFFDDLINVTICIHESSETKFHRNYWR